VRYRRDIGAALVVAGACVVLGLLAGVVWGLIAPRPFVVVVSGDVAVEPYSTEAFFAADARFVLVAAVAGALVGMATWTRTRDDGIGALVGLALGGLGAAVVAWRTGVWVGPEPIAQPPTPGTRVEGPIQLGSRGALFVLPIAAVTTYFMLTAGWAKARDEAAATPG
jgi:hypothetical protein